MQFWAPTLTYAQKKLFSHMRCSYELFLTLPKRGSLGELKSVWNAISKDIKQSLAPYYKVSVKSKCADLCWCENKAGNTPMY